MPRAKTADLLMWVGAVHYPTVGSFVSEAERLGVSKRVAVVPSGVKLGKSILFLAHDEAARATCGACRGAGVDGGRLSIQLVKKDGRSWVPVTRAGGARPTAIRKTVTKASAFRSLRDKTYRESDRKHKWLPVPGQKTCRECAGRGEVPDGRIFGFCIIDRLELIFDCEAAVKEYAEREPDRMNGVPVKHVPGIEDEPERGCGFRAIGGYYLVSEGKDAEHDASEIAGKLGDGFVARGPVVVLPDPVPCPWGRFRAAKVVDKDVILKSAMSAARKLGAASAKRSKKKRAKRRAK